MKVFHIALINMASVLYLAFVLCFMLGISEQDKITRILTATGRRWIKLVGVLVILGCIVHLISSF